MNKSFSHLGVVPRILSALEELGFHHATEVQQAVIPSILEGKDVIVMAKTGSGKTAAFGIPLLQTLIQNEGHDNNQGVKALILTPTRELAVQVESDIKQIAKDTGIRTTAVYGQHNMDLEVKALNKGSAVVVGTPGRVIDHLERGQLKTEQIQFLVLDEADRMLDMGFIDQVVKIIKSLAKNRVTMLFSATMPLEVRMICQEYMNSPTTIELSSDTKTVDTIKQLYYRVESVDKKPTLNRLLRKMKPASCMVFCNTRNTVDKVNNYLLAKGYQSEAIHGMKSQTNRMKTIDSMKKNTIQIMVATDVAARGIHIDDLSLVINYDIPVEKDSYVHRIGRTGRAGNGGLAISLVSSNEIMSLYEIEEHIGVLIEEAELQVHEPRENPVPKERILHTEKAKFAENPKVMEKPKVVERQQTEERVYIPREVKEKKEIYTNYQLSPKQLRRIEEAKQRKLGKQGEVSDNNPRIKNSFIHWLVKLFKK
ncbi:MAG: DEAD/DEAH box helicase [Vallitaleaceae bacterium]|nr:DEAD/DEAH box helicase [Vallitaleaceae bacterium]